ncbi:MAG: hypothetical protein C0468_06970 [Planctomyces sp.]|nr:hypothetical protein [Planctomyces sp.]
MPAGRPPATDTQEHAVTTNAQAIADHPAQGTQSLALTLRDATKDAHVAAEKHPFHGMLFSGRLPREAFAAQLAQAMHLQTVLEAGLSRASAAPAVSAVVRPHHFRLELFERDLRAWGVEPAATSASAATRALGAWIDQHASAAPAGLLGVLYVVEGSTNGAQFIAKAVRRAYRLADDAPGLASLDPHGPAQQERWQAFRRDLDLAPLSPPDRAAALQGANGAFGWASAVMDELMATAARAMAARS